MWAIINGNKSSSSEGMTMLEVMVAFSLLAIALLGLAPAIIFMAQMNTQNQSMTRARLIMEQYSERIRSINYENMFITDDGDTNDLANLTQPDHADTVIADGIRYAVLWNVKDNSPAINIKTIQIYVVWRDPTSGLTKRINTLNYKAAVTR